MKMYFVCENGGPQWFHSYGVLENGFCFGTHICSHPLYAPGDLYFDRQDRIGPLKELFGIDPKTIETETIIVNSKKDIPDWWDEHAKLQEGLMPQYEKYKEMKEQYIKDKIEVDK